MVVIDLVILWLCSLPSIDSLDPPLVVRRTWTEEKRENSLYYNVFVNISIISPALFLPRSIPYCPGKRAPLHFMARILHRLATQNCYYLEFRIDIDKFLAIFANRVARNLSISILKLSISSALPFTHDPNLAPPNKNR